MGKFRSYKESEAIPRKSSEQRNEIIRVSFNNS